MSEETNEEDTELAISGTEDCPYLHLGCRCPKKKPVDQRNFMGRLLAIFTGEAQTFARNSARKHSQILRETQRRRR